jgi:hypothetical protein
MIDCEINENIIISKDERFLKLMEYLQWMFVKNY